MLGTPPAPAPSGPGDFAGAGVVSRIVDGDTLDVVEDDGSPVTIRVLGIDTPETKDPRKPVQCWGSEATIFAELTLMDKHVTLFTDGTQATHDRYGRLLAYVLLPESQSNYSVLAAQAGVARSYVFENRPVTLNADIVAAEQNAKARRLGLWGPPCDGVVDFSPSPTDSASPPASPSEEVPMTGAPPAGQSFVYYGSCAAARAAGSAPLYRGQPGYRAALDRDGDGVACE